MVSDEIEWSTSIPIPEISAVIAVFKEVPEECRCLRTRWSRRCGGSLSGRDAESCEVD